MSFAKKYIIPFPDSLSLALKAQGWQYTSLKIWDGLPCRAGYFSAVYRVDAGVIWRFSNGVDTSSVYRVDTQTATLKPDVPNWPHRWSFLFFVYETILNFHTWKWKEKVTYRGLFSRYRPSKSSNFEAKMHWRQRKTSFSSMFLALSCNSLQNPPETFSKNWFFER